MARVGKLNPSGHLAERKLLCVDKMKRNVAVLVLEFPVCQSRYEDRNEED
jgi:hypothetical protein